MPKKIKALLLSAGFGTRLRPITNQVPKCLIDVNKKPILEFWLSKLEEIGCMNFGHIIFIKVRNYLYQETKNMIIKEKYEQKLLGTAGTLIKIQTFSKIVKS